MNTFMDKFNKKSMTFDARHLSMTKGIDGSRAEIEWPGRLVLNREPDGVVAIYGMGKGSLVVGPGICRVDGNVVSLDDENGSYSWIIAA